jgi:hypothetical protein
MACRSVALQPTNQLSLRATRGHEPPDLGGASQSAAAEGGSHRFAEVRQPPGERPFPKSMSEMHLRKTVFSQDARLVSVIWSDDPFRLPLHAPAALRWGQDSYGCPPDSTALVFSPQELKWKSSSAPGSEDSSAQHPLHQLEGFILGLFPGIHTLPLLASHSEPLWHALLEPMQHRSCLILAAVVDATGPHFVDHLVRHRWELAPAEYVASRPLEWVAPVHRGVWTGPSGDDVAASMAAPAPRATVVLWHPITLATEREPRRVWSTLLSLAVFMEESPLVSRVVVAVVWCVTFTGWGDAAGRRESSDPLRQGHGLCRA